MRTWTLTVCPDCGNEKTGVSLCEHQRQGNGPTGIDFEKMVSVGVIELDPMLDLLEPMWRIYEADGDVEAPMQHVAALLREHGRLQGDSDE